MKTGEATTVVYWHLTADPKEAGVILSTAVAFLMHSAEMPEARVLCVTSARQKTLRLSKFSTLFTKACLAVTS